MMKLGIFFYILLSLFSYLVVLTNVQAMEKESVRYFVMAFGDITYTAMNDESNQHYLKNGTKKTVSYLLGTELCVTSKSGLLVLKDSERVDHYLNQSSGCYVVTDPKKPSMMLQIKRYLPKSIATGEASIPGMTPFDASESHVTSHEKHMWKLYLNQSNSISIIDKKWITNNLTLPIKIQMIGKNKNKLFEQISRTRGFTYFSVPANLLPRMNGAFLKVTDKTNKQLIYVKMYRDSRGDWTYEDAKTSSP